MSSRDERCINSIKVMCAEMITKANSGHPGICLGAAPIMHTLFSKMLKIDPNNPDWYNRDRFILSAGHGSALLYSILSLSGFNISKQDLMNFRQKGSLTPGHPEYKHTDGVEMTTGPLGQGIASAVGMAIAERSLASRFNREEFNIIDHYTYVLCGDGDLQEGVALEALSIAGHLKLNKLIVLYDSNDIQLDGPTSLATSENTLKKFQAMGWNTIKVAYGSSPKYINTALKKAQLSDKPTLIEFKTIIGEGISLAGTNQVHGKPLTKEQVLELRTNLDCNDKPFEFNKSVINYYRENVLLRGSKLHNEWRNLLLNYKNKFPEEANILENIFKNKNNNIKFINYDIDNNSYVSTRKVVGKLLKQYADDNLDMIGGSADLASSCMVEGIDGNFTSENYKGRNIAFGVREHAMAAITNGLTLSNLRAFSGGFFVFVDYLKASIRLASLMNIPSLFVFSHDSICVGEDGPTHQPIEQLTMLRSIPNLNVVRPCDAHEMSFALREALNKNTYPTVLISTRQDVKVLETTNYEGFKKGAYIVYEPTDKFDLIILACGSEVELAISTAIKLKETSNLNVRVVSIPSMFIFEKQSKEYKEEILPSNSKIVAVELGATMPWYRYTKHVYGIDTFGQSMPMKDIIEEYGFTVEKLTEYIQNI